MVKPLKIDTQNPQPERLEQAKKILKNGGIVIIPTETVYGIACDPAVPGAMNKLIAAKGRADKKPIARLAADTEQVKADAKDWNAGLQALATQYWPGPLTIVLETKDHNWTGYRVPNHAVALKLAELCGHTLALTSANRSGEPDTKTAQEALASIQADLALDSGISAEQAIPSTVIKIAGKQIECLREGRLPFTEIESVFKEALLTKNILFVCTGNTCRSPMAEVLFRLRSKNDLQWSATSAGIFAGIDSPASTHSIQAMHELNIDLSNHRSKPLTPDLIESADLIVTMTAGHRFQILQNFPKVGNKVCLIKSFGTSKVPADITDPFGGSLNVYQKTRDEIDQALSDLILFIHTENH